MRVLLVEDDDSIATSVVEGLRRERFDVDWVTTGRAALDAEHGDVVLLDLGLPDMDGFDVCRRLRDRTDAAIIVLTARNTETDRVIGLELGADDYLGKPFGMRELVARIRAVRRRTRHAGGPPAEEVLAHGPLRMDLRTREVSAHGVPVTLTPKEFDLLAYLLRDPTTVHRRQRILEEVWDPHWYGPSKTLDVHIASLRRKLGDPNLIETVRGVGFRAAAPSERLDAPR